MSFVSDPDRYASSQMQSLIDFCKYVPQFEQVSPDSADLLFLHHQQYKHFEGQTCIIVERADSSSLVFARPFLNMDNVLGVFKHTLLRPIELQNTPFLFRRYHIGLLEDAYQLGREKECLEKVTRFDKLYCKVPMFMRWHTDRLFIPRKDVKKDKDVLCRCTLQKIPHIQRHRGDAIRKSGGGNMLLPKEDWTDTLYRSKICVCPWGYGEMCYRDYEAMLSGCIVVKPNSDFIETWPDIYRDGVTYVACKHDLSDLNEICQKVLDNYDDYGEMIEHNHKMLREPDFDKMVAEFTEVLRSLGTQI